VVALVPNEIVDEQMQIGEVIAEASTIDVDRIEMDLEIIILMIEEQKIIVPIIIVPNQKNANEDVEPRAHIDGVTY
jgi:hypothetical protein